MDRESISDTFSAGRGLPEHWRRRPPPPSPPRTGGEDNKQNGERRPLVQESTIIYGHTTLTCERYWPASRCAWAGNLWALSHNWRSACPPECTVRTPRRDGPGILGRTRPGSFRRPTYLSWTWWTWSSTDTLCAVLQHRTVGWRRSGKSKRRKTCMESVRLGGQVLCCVNVGWRGARVTTLKAYKAIDKLGATRFLSAIVSAVLK